MAEGLTKRQREVLNTLERYIWEEGYVPSYRQIGQAIGCSSLSTVHKHVHRLKDKGYLTLKDWQAASIQIVDQKLICCPECQHIFVAPSAMESCRKSPSAGRLLDGQEHSEYPLQPNQCNCIDGSWHAIGSQGCTMEAVSGTL
jgi:SOS-response transcriptional repressor LexA